MQELKDEQQALACRIATALLKVSKVNWRVGRIKKSIPNEKELRKKIKIGDVVIYALLKKDSEMIHAHKVPKIKITGATQKDLKELSNLLVNNGIKIPKKCIG